MSLIIMYILKCLDIILKLIINQTGVDIFKFYQVKIFYKQTIVVSAMENDGVPLTFPARFRIFLLIILWGKCVLGINYGQTGIKLH